MGEIILTPFDIIFKAIRLELKISKEELKGRSRRRDISEARQMFCLLSREYTKETLKTIGLEINKDHSSVLYSVRAMEDLCNHVKRLSISKGTIEKNLRLNLKKVIVVPICEHCNQPICN